MVGCFLKRHENRRIIFSRAVLFFLAKCGILIQWSHYAPVAQLDRAIASDAMCRAFESHWARQTS